MIPDNICDSNTEYKNIATQYGGVSIEKIGEFDETYVNTPTRAAQDFNIMYKCIMNLLLVLEKN